MSRAGSAVLEEEVLTVLRALMWWEAKAKARMYREWRQLAAGVIPLLFWIFLTSWPPSPSSSPFPDNQVRQVGGAGRGGEAGFRGGAAQEAGSQFVTGKTREAL